MLVSNRLFATLVTLLVSSCAFADVTYPERPGDRDFIADHAGMIDAEDQAAVVATCDALLSEKQIPIIVCTITSMGGYGSPGPIERYAAEVFDEWGIGYEEYDDGILLLVAEGDRKARIELGADWGREHDRACQRIMDHVIIPRFKAGDFSTGIREGVDALDALARGESIPWPSWAERAERSTTGFIGRAFGFLVGNCLMVVLFPR